MKETDIAYLAGIIDGEGSITINRNTKYTNGRVSLRPKVTVSMTHEPTIAHIWSIGNASGNHWIDRRRTGVNHYVAEWRYQDAARILRELMPYLITKREQAKLMIELCELREENQHAGTRDISENYKKQELIASKIKLLNASKRVK